MKRLTAIRACTDETFWGLRGIDKGVILDIHGLSLGRWAEFCDAVGLGVFGQAGGEFGTGRCRVSAASRRGRHTTPLVHGLLACHVSFAATRSSPVHRAVVGVSRGECRREKRPEGLATCQLPPRRAIESISFRKPPGTQPEHRAYRLARITPSSDTVAPQLSRQAIRGGNSSRFKAN